MLLKPPHEAGVDVPVNETGRPTAMRLTGWLAGLTRKSLHLPAIMVFVSWSCRSMARICALSSRGSTRSRRPAPRTSIVFTARSLVAAGSSRSEASSRTETRPAKFSKGLAIG